MTAEQLPRLEAYLGERYPQFTTGVREAVSRAPERFGDIAEMYLQWLLQARGENGLFEAVDAFVQFTTDVNLAQARYEADGKYEYQSFAEVNDIHYSQDSQMYGYLWGIYLTNFLWAHHLEICLFFKDRFLSRIDDAGAMIEIAPGHGGWGAWALHELPEATLRGFDISPTSIRIASSVMEAAGMESRASYVQKDAMELAEVDAESADAGISSFLIEHLEQPQRLFDVIHHLLKPGGVFFVTGALTAAQIDHIYEFHKESELVAMAENSGLRVLETLSTNPARTLPRARFLPRSMALLVQKPVSIG
ncbi:MAG: class I SAM-dependent methyltransferase [Gammaproteobacteria bacterium]|nr:class I SAM-dependent methyltransferase [Gammaproteobacteria bacterium]